MKWEVRGALRETGEDTIIFIEADNKESAERRAGRRGLVVESVQQVGGPVEGDSVAGVDVATAIQAEARQLPERPRRESPADLAARMSGNGHPAPAVAGACPQCGSTDTRKAEMIYMQGTSTKSFSGMSFDSAGDVGAFGGKGVSVSALAQRMAPPKMRSRGGLGLWISCCVFGAFLFLGVVTGDRDTWPGFLVATAICGLIGLGGFLADRGAGEFNSKEYPALMNRWRNTWCCMRCGTSFLK